MTEVSMSVARDSSGRCEVVGCRSRSASRVPASGSLRYVCQVHLMTLWFFASKAVAFGEEEQDAGQLLSFRPQVLDPVPVVRDDRGPGERADTSELRHREGRVVEPGLPQRDAPAPALPRGTGKSPQSPSDPANVQPGSDAGRGG